MASASQTFTVPLPNGSRLPIFPSIPFVSIHAAVLSLFWLSFHWSYVALCAVVFAMRMFFITADTSENNWLLALLTLGEGWHNNHHHFMASARQGFFWWELDLTYYVLKLLSWFGVVWDLRGVPAHKLAEQDLAA